MPRTIEQIDRDFAANRRELMTRLRFDPGYSAHSWQAAWNRCPDLYAREQALCRECSGVREEEDAKAEHERRTQLRRERAFRTWSESLRRFGLAIDRAA